MKESLSFWGSFFGAFVRPRKVVRSVIDRNPRYFVWPFILAYSLLAATDPASYFFFLRKVPLSTLLPLEVGLTFMGMVGLFWAFIAFAYFAGKLMGGTGTFQEIAAAYTWCLPPAFVGILLNLLAAIPTWLQIFSGTNDPAVLVASKTAWQSAFGFLYFILIVWSLALDIFVIAEAHRFPAWKSLVINLVAAFMALLIGISIGVFLVVFGLH